MATKPAVTLSLWAAVLMSTLGLLALGPVQVQGGSGAFDGSAYTFCVAVRFDASPDDINRIKAVFTAASQASIRPDVKSLLEKRQSSSPPQAFHMSTTRGVQEREHSPSILLLAC